jgi:hypothetical protein
MITLEASSGFYCTEQVEKENAEFERLVAGKAAGMRAFVGRPDRLGFGSVVMVGSEQTSWERGLVCYEANHRERAAEFARRYNRAACS